MSQSYRKNQKAISVYKTFAVLRNIKCASKLSASNTQGLPASMSQVQLQPGAEMCTTSSYKYIQILNSLQDKWLSMTQLQLYAESMGPQSTTPPIPFCSWLIKRFQEFPSFHQMPTVCFWILWVIGTFLLWPTYQRWNRQGELIQKNLCFLPKKSLQTLQKLIFQRSMQA